MAVNVGELEDGLIVKVKVAVRGTAELFSEGNYDKVTVADVPDYLAILHLIQMLETTSNSVQIVAPTLTLGDYLALNPTPLIVNNYPPIAAASIEVILNPITVTQILSA